MAFPLPHVILPTTLEHKQTIIFLHGRGSNGKEVAEDLRHDRSSAGRNLQQHFEAASTKWIFPSAHTRHSTFWDFEQEEWFDIWSFTDTSARPELQVDGLRESVQHICSIVEEEIKAGIAPLNIFLGGMSQGFATAVHVLLAQPRRLGGFFGISGWCPFRNDLNALNRDETVLNLRNFYAEELDIVATTTAETLRTPVFIAHCEDDNVVEICHGREARDTLLNLGMNPCWKEYNDGEHWINEPQGLDDIVAFIQQGVDA